MQKTASKNIVFSRSYDFFKIWLTIQLLYAYKLQIAVSKNDFRNIFEKTMHGRGPMLCSYVPFMSFNNLISGVFDFFRFLWVKMYARFANLAIFGT